MAFQNGFGSRPNGLCGVSVCVCVSRATQVQQDSLTTLPFKGEDGWVKCYLWVAR